MNTEIKNIFEKIKYIVIDVDGTMTDAGIYYDNNGNELKKFNTKDAAGFFAAKKAGIKTIVLTGRECAAVARRMEELKVDYLAQNIKDKVNYMLLFMKENAVSKEEIAYIGDDLNDLPAMNLTGLTFCPADACEEVISFADYVSAYKGGQGAVRDCICHLLKIRGEWESAIAAVYDIGI